jgi:methyl-accepting chemotaxis protein
MTTSLSTNQRIAIVVGLIMSSQGCVIAAYSMGWSPYVGFGGSAVSTVLAAWVLISGSSALRSFLAEVTGHAQKLAAGDLAAPIHVSGPAEQAEVLSALQGLQGSLRSTLGGIRGGADSIATAAQEIAQGNADLSQRTEQTAANLQQAAGAMAQLTNTVNQTADSARTANQLAASASEVAGRGGDVVAQVVSTMNEINQSSKKIADIIGTIDGIAFQTNILALNAAVEAARAGEQGRGFAVVASEVRSLAQRSAEAAREIKSLIGASVEKVESGSRLVADAGSTMTEIVGSVQRVSDIIGEISAAAAEQSQGIGQVNHTVTELDQATQQNAALVEQGSAAAESLKDQSRQLAAAVAGFRLGDGGHSGHAPAAPRHVSPTLSAPAATASKALAKARSTPAPKQAAPAPVKAHTPAAAPTPAPASTSAGSDDWETF